MNGYRTQHYYILLTIIVSACFFFPPESEAQAMNSSSGNRSEVKTYRTDPTGEGALTEEMIENCIISKRDIDSKYSEINTFETQIDSMQSEIEEMKNQLSETKDKINRIRELEQEGLDTRNKFLSPNDAEPEELTKEYKTLLDEYIVLLSPFNQLQEIIDAYNEKFDLLSTKITESNDLLNQYNQLLTPFNRLQEKYRQECKDQPYYDDDYNRVLEKIGE